jgi:Flp pilus assembly protein TadG
MRRRNNRNSRRRELGQSLAEFALAAPVLFILIFGLIDTARMYNAWVTTQHAAREGARYGVTGRIDCNIASPDRLACIEHTARSQTLGLTNASTDVTVDVRSWEYPAYADPATEGSAGEQCDALEVRVEYDFTTSIPGIEAIFGPVHLVARERLVNEPFGPCA